MDLELRHLKCLVAIIGAGTFTDAAAQLNMSQAAVSRTLAALERALGVRLLDRTSRSIAPTAAGDRVLVRARQLLAEADALVHEARTGHSHLRLGHAWSAIGEYTVAFQRAWARRHPDIELTMIRSNTPTGGLAEGLCDVAIVRADIDTHDFDRATVGFEPRLVAMARDDRWAHRRTIRLDDIRGRTLAVDARTGTTTTGLWPDGDPPAVEYIHDIDDWLTAIAAGRCVGITPQATASQYRRDGVVYRPLRGASPVAVQAIWRRGDPHPAIPAAVALLAEQYRGHG